MPLSHDELKVVLTEMSLLVLDDNACIRDAGAKIKSLLEHAVEMLNKSFFSVNNEIAPKNVNLNNESDQKSSEDNGLLGALQKALLIANNLNQLLSKTTQSLQVEDIISQVVNQVSLRTESTDGVLHEIKQYINTEDETVSLENLVAKMRELRMSNTLDSLRQSSLNEGGIELF